MNILNFPVELLVIIFLYVKTLKTRSICQYFNEIFKQDKYNVTTILEHYYSKIVNFEKIPFKVLERLSKKEEDFKKLLSININISQYIWDISYQFDFSRKIQNIGKNYMLLEKKNSYYFNHFNNILSNGFLNLINNLLENNFDELVLFIIKINKSHIKNYLRNILVLVSKHNKLNLFLTLFNQYKIPFKEFVNYWSSYLYYFLSNDNWIAIKLLNNYKKISIVELCYYSIELGKDAIIKKYIGKLSFEEKIILINQAIYYSNTNSFDIIMTKEFIKLTKGKKCLIRYNEKDIELTFFDAISFSAANCDFFIKFFEKTQSSDFTFEKYCYNLAVHQNRSEKNYIYGSYKLDYLTKIQSQSKRLVKREKKAKKEKNKLIKMDNRWFTNR